MAKQRTHSQSPKSFAGTARLGLGALILRGNLHLVADRLTHLAGTATRGPLGGVFPFLVLTAWKLLQAYTFDRQQLWAGVLQMLVSLWPLAFVVAGAALSRDVWLGKVEPPLPTPTRHPRMKDSRPVDFTVSRSTCK